jgi:hypothetical protein
MHLAPTNMEGSDPGQRRRGRDRGAPHWPSIPPRPVLGRPTGAGGEACPSIIDPHTESPEQPLSTHQAWTTPASSVDEFGFLFEDFDVDGVLNAI